jgi:TolB-like protein/Tfp pilus assembly protein PilF
LIDAGDGMRARLFGGLEIAGRDGAEIKFATRKSALVLAILALSGPKGMRRERLCGLLWADREEPQARASLRQALVELRRHIAADGTIGLEIAGDSDLVALSVPGDEIDAWRFDRLLKSGDLKSFEEAAELYGGELLSGIEMPEAVGDWVAPIRQEYARKALRLVDKLSAQADVTSPFIAACERLAERLLLVDPSAEEAHRALIRIYQRQRKTSAAARQMRICVEALRQTLGVEPERETIALLEPEAVQRHRTTAPLNETAERLPLNRPSVVVMPFENLSGPDDELFVDGFVEEITATLSRIRDFFVIARQSAFAGKERFADVHQLGQELGVRYVVQGALRRAGDNVRITVRLVEAESRALVWTERYEGGSTDAFSLQDRIAEQVAGAMHPALLQAEIAAARRKPPESLKAYELVLQAQAKMWNRTESENHSGIALLNQAIAIDPNYGRAYAILAWCHSQNIVYLWSLDADRERQLVRQAIGAAAPLIGDDPLAMTALGAALYQGLNENSRARTYVEAALTLDPNSAWAWARLGWIIEQFEEFEAAKECFERALRLSPLDPLAFNFRFGIASCLGHTERFEEASQMLQALLNRYPESAWGHRMLAAFAALAGDMETARASIKALLDAQPQASIAVMKRNHPSRNTPRMFDRLLKGWRLAGLPEE